MGCSAVVRLQHKEKKKEGLSYLVKNNVCKKVRKDDEANTVRIEQRVAEKNNEKHE